MQVAQGRALLGLDRAAEAKVQFDAALRAQPDNFDALLGLASATYKTDGLAAAKGVLEKAPTEASSARVLDGDGRYRAAGGDFATAEKASRRRSRRPTRAPRASSG